MIRSFKHKGLREFFETSSLLSSACSVSVVNKR